MKATLFSVCILLYSSLVHADFLEVLSQGSSRLWGAEACQSASGQEMLSAAKESRECIQSRGNQDILSSAVHNAKSILHVARRANETVDQKSEAEFFAALGLQHANELKCSADFAKSISGDDAKARQAREDIATKIKTARAAKQRLVSLTRELATNKNLSRRVCEVGENLKPNPIEVEVRGQDIGYEICKQVLEARTSLDVVKRLIPLGGAPQIHELVDNYINSDSAVADKITDQLDAHIKQAYAATEAEVTNSAKNLAKQALTVPQVMDRATKHALLSDPLVTRKVIESGGDKNRSVMEAMACRADQRYGQGAEDLDKTLLIGSVVVSTGAGLALRASAYAARFAVGAQNIRAAGYLSINASRALEYSAIGLTVGVDAVAAYSQMDAACNLKPEQLAQGTTSEGACVMAPTIEQLGKDSCVMAKVLLVLNFSTALIPTALKAEKVLQNSKTFRDVDLLTASKLSDDERLREAASVINRPLTSSQEKALLQAHEVGAGQYGKYNQPAGVGNYTETQLKKKADILKEAQFTTEERRKLMENGIVGGPDYLNNLAVKTPSLPKDWPESVQKDFEKALDTASKANAPMRAGGNSRTVPVALEDVQTAVASQVGLRADNLTPVITTEGGGKVVMTYTSAFGKKIMVKLNATNGQYYYTIIERMDGRDTYMMLSPGSNGRRWGGLRPCKDMAQCHYNVGY